MAIEPSNHMPFRFVLRDFAEDQDHVAVGAWTPSTGFLPSTELVLPRTTIAEVVPDGPVVEVYGASLQTAQVTFHNTGSLDLAWLFHQLVGRATVEHELGSGLVQAERDWCGWSWPVMSAPE